MKNIPQNLNFTYSQTINIEQQQQQKQGVQELQPFAFCVVTVNDKHKSRFKRKLKGSI